MVGEKGSRVVPEIEGMRALAVLAVCLFHYRLGVPGGQIGVDVFLVVSGYLITGAIIRELESSGRFSFVDFYARRVRRLLPAASLVLLLTLAASVLLLETSSHVRDAWDSIWSAGFVQNIHLVRLGPEARADHGIARHYWSLSVEEQFYLLWPLLIVGVWRVSRGKPRTGVGLLTAVVIACSYPLGVGRGINTPGIYFSSLARAWELAAGGLGYLVLTWRGRQPLRAAIGWVGLCMVVRSGFIYTPWTALPGPAALLPIGGVLGVLLSLEGRWGPVQVLGLRPLQWLGARSYGIYLWHWPLLVLLQEMTPDPGRGARLLGIAATLALSAVMYRWIENPVRHAGRLVRSPPATLAMGAALVATVVGVSALIIAMGL